MNVLVITTNTIHHKIFLSNLNLTRINLNIIFETRQIKFKFVTNHSYFIKRDQYEKKFLKNFNFEKEIREFKNVNSRKCIDHINKLKPEVILLFGTGKVKQNFLKKFKNIHIVNLHGGNPEEYRGLDSLLWCIYHKDFKNLLTTLHYVDENLDTGKIIKQIKIKTKELNIFNLRYLNTMNCISLFNYFLKNIKKIRGIKQKKIGRYYSAIPSVLIDKCIKNLNK